MSETDVRVAGGSRIRGLPPPGPRFGLDGLVLKRRTG
jgi:hypothetical protein